MKAYLYINPKAPGEVKDLLAEHFSDVSRVSSVFMQEVKSEQHACISSSSLIVLPAKGIFDGATS